MSGVRTEGYQALRCPTCGGGIFVLPRSPLPEPAAPSGKKTSRAVNVVLQRPDVYDDERDDPVALTDPVMPSGPTPDVDLDEPEEEVVWEDEQADDLPPLQPSRSKGPVDAPEDLAAAEMERTAASALVRKPRPKPKSAEPVAVEAQLPRASFSKRFAPRRNTLIFMGVGLLVLCTVLFQVWRARIADLPRVAELGKTEGLAALDDGKFQLAHQILAEAKRAVISLGDAYEGAEAIKQGADEAAVFADFDPSRLEEMLDEASRADPKAWEKSFVTLYKNRYILIDSEIKAVPDGRGSGTYEVHYVVFPDGGDGEAPRSIARIDLAGLRLFELTHPRKDDRVIFGARIATFQFDKAGNEWVVRLVPDSGVTITHDKALVSLGWPSGNEAAKEGGP